MIQILILVAIYLLSAFAFWNYIRISHSENGQWSLAAQMPEILLLCSFQYLIPWCYLCGSFLRLGKKILLHGNGFVIGSLI